MNDRSTPLSSTSLSVNAHVRPWVDRLLRDAPATGLLVQRDDSGVCIIDGGIHAPGSIAAGLQVAEICMGGYGSVALRNSTAEPWPTWLDVHSAQPVLACLASQYAGWSLSASKEETGGKKFFSLGSGPARALAAKEKLFEELDYRDRADHGVLILEVDRMPPEVVLRKVLRDCGLSPDSLTVILTPTSSTTGTTQVVARVLEVAMHKAHELGFALTDIVEGTACAPLPAPCTDGITAMGRTNDAILYGGRVHLSVRGSDDAARDLARRLPSRNSRDYGKSFAEIFKDVECDFYKIDPALFAPAEVWVSNLESGNTWHGGALNFGLLHDLWLQQA